MGSGRGGDEEIKKKKKGISTSKCDCKNRFDWQSDTIDVATSFYNVITVYKPAVSIISSVNLERDRREKRERSSEKRDVTGCKFV